MCREHDKRHVFADLHPHTCWEGRTKKAFYLEMSRQQLKTTTAESSVWRVCYPAKSCVLTLLETWSGTRINRKSTSEKTQATNCVKSLYWTKTDDQIHSKTCPSCVWGGIRQARGQQVFNCFWNRNLFSEIKKALIKPALKTVEQNIIATSQCRLILNKSLS